MRSILKLTLSYFYSSFWLLDLPNQFANKFIKKYIQVIIPIVLVHFILAISFIFFSSLQKITAADPSVSLLSVSKILRSPSRHGFIFLFSNSFVRSVYFSPSSFTLALFIALGSEVELHLQTSYCFLCFYQFISIVWGQCCLVL